MAIIFKMYSSRYDLEQKVSLIGEVERLGIVNHELKRHNEALRDEIHRLQKNSGSRIPEMRRTISQLDKKLQEKDEELKARDSERESINPRIEALSTERDQIKNLLKQREIELEASVKESESIKITKEIVAKLNNSNDLLNAELFQKDQEIRDLNSEKGLQFKKLEQMQQEIHHLIESLERQQDEAEDWRARAAILENNQKFILDKDNLISQLDHEKEDLGLEIKEKTRQIQHLSKKLDNIGDENQKLKKALVEQERSVEASHKKIRRLKSDSDKENENLRKEIETIKRNEQELGEREKAHIKVIQRDLLEELSQLKYRLQQAEDSSKQKDKTIDTLNLENRSLEDEISLKNNTRLLDKDRAIETLRTKNSDTERELARLKARISRSDDLHAELLEKEEKVFQLDVQNKKLEVEISQMNDKLLRLEHLKDQILEKDGELATLRAKLQDSELLDDERIDEINRQWELKLKTTLEQELNEQFEQYAEDKVGLESEVARLASDKSELEKENDRIKADLERANYEIEQLSNRLMDYENKITLLSLEVQRLNGLCEKKEARLDEMERKQQSSIDQFGTNTREWQYLNQRAEEEAAHYKDKALHVEEKLNVVLDENYKLGSRLEQIEKELEAAKKQLKMHGIVPLNMMSEALDLNGSRRLNGSRVGSRGGSPSKYQPGFSEDGLSTRVNNTMSQEAGNDRNQAYELKIMSQNATITNLEEKIRILESEREHFNQLH